MKAPSPRSRTALAQRAIDLAIASGQHQIVIDEHGRTTILPLQADLKQVDEAALDAGIRELIDKGDGVGRH